MRLECSAESAAHDRRSALVIAHPGHELRVHGWLERVKPVVFVLTDGSGGSRVPRIGSTRRLIGGIGASQGPIFGTLSDRELYEALVNVDTGFFTALADEIAASLCSLGVQTVLADACEGYNSGHDICRAVVDAAVMIAQATTNTSLATFEFLLVGSPDHADPDGVRIELEDSALARKIAAARAYPEMAQEVDAALERFGAEAFRIECLRSRPGGEWRPSDGDEQPYYETYGEQQVAAGLYSQVIRARQHLDPVVEALFRHARTRAQCTLSPSC
jgi:hypothetical protein